MKNRQLAAVLATIVLLAVIAAGVLLMLHGGESGMALVYEVGAALGTGVAGILTLLKMLPDRDGDGIPDALQRGKRGEEE